MYSNPVEVRAAVRRYVVVFAALVACTVLTVAASQLHLVVPLAITVALAIAAVKGSMVAAVFMHLSHEKKAVYGALLLTAVFVVALLFIPTLTLLDQIGVPR